MNQVSSEATPDPEMPGVLPNVLAAIGNTPLIRLHRVARDTAAILLAKAEFLNPGGSVKDRIGVEIVDAAESEGRLRPGGTIVESTSGNTGVGLAIVAALRGYKTVFVMPDKMSAEKIRLLRSFGARVVITPTAVLPDDPRSYYSVAKRLADEIPNAILANQYHNPANPLAHYRTTGPEIWQQTGGKVTHFVCALGTGGTISGVGKYLKERNPDLQVVGVDPIGSVLYEYFYTGVMPEAHTYKVEGIGEDFLPSTTDFSFVDDVVQVTDGESFGYARRLIREEGLFVGGSSGSALAGALKYCSERNMGDTSVVVVLLPDSGSRYLSKFLDDEWMREHGFAPDDEMRGKVSDLLTDRPRRPLITVVPTATITAVIHLMTESDISQVPVVEAGELLGVVTERDLLTHMLAPQHTQTVDETIAPIVSNKIAVVEPATKLGVLGQIFAEGDVALVRANGEWVGVLTKIDLIDHMARRIEP
jgi:cystathionine beta-synthase